MKTESRGRPTSVGPILFLRGWRPEGIELAALFVCRPDGHPGDLETEHGTVRPETLHGRCGFDVLRYAFTLPARTDASYRLGGERYQVNADFSGDLRLAYVSCNGQEHGDLDRPGEQRNLMWRRLAERHDRAPLNLLLHGGDQIYADELSGAHPLSAGWPDDVPDVDAAAAGELTTALGDAFFLRYLEQFAQPGFAPLVARVPSLAMWDDHDICDGWGSLHPDRLDSAVGRHLFAAARDHFLLFQFGAAPDEVPSICLDETGQSLTWQVKLPGLQLVAPDLRSERRRDRIIGDRGWQLLRRAFADAEAGRVLLLSSVPALGPRLSLVERLMHITPRMEKYEDDLRDQWQSRAHRDEWRAFLRELISLHERSDTSVTVVSGEIHLATRGTMDTGAGPLHQLVASGIAHPAPPGAYARTLGALASLGEAPLRGHRIRLHPLPGQRRIYAAERNFLLLERKSGDWTAIWDLENSLATPPLAL